MKNSITPYQNFWVCHKITIRDIIIKDKEGAENHILNQRPMKNVMYFNVMLWLCILDEITQLIKFLLFPTLIENSTIFRDE